MQCCPCLPPQDEAISISCSAATKKDRKGPVVARTSRCAESFVPRLPHPRCRSHPAPWTEPPFNGHGNALGADRGPRLNNHHAENNRRIFTSRGVLDIYTTDPSSRPANCGQCS